MATYVCVLPVDLLDGLTTHVDHSANFLRLPHPRTGIASLFLPVKGPKDTAGDISVILEVQAVTPAETRSWFLDNEVVSDGRLLLMSPIDPTFLLFPILQATNPPEDGYEHHFRPADDIFEDASLKIEERCGRHDDTSYDVNAQDILQLASLPCIKDALRRVCDMKEITSKIEVYRFSESKALEYLRKKVAYLSSPSTVEGSKTLLRNLAKDGLFDDGKEKLLEGTLLARIRAACETLSQYLPKSLGGALEASYDFGDLEKHLKNLRDEVIAPGNPKPKRESTSAAMQHEDKKRKNKASQGVEKLKKTNVNGMAKLSSYFKKA
ncbi:ribonuclease H2, subunit B [Amanita rubescens]|nr:ribonuclease H2, subunit B [Amanita rubescens]